MARTVLLSARLPVVIEMRQGVPSYTSVLLKGTGEAIAWQSISEDPPSGIKLPTISFEAIAEANLGLTSQT